MVKVMGIGGTIEAAVEKRMRESLKSLNASALAYLETQVGPNSPPPPEPDPDLDPDPNPNPLVPWPTLRRR